MNIKRIALFFITPFVLSSCSYLESVSKHEELIQTQEINPSQHNLKHIIDRETFIVYGLLLGKSGKLDNQHLSVAAYSDRFKIHELVDVTHLANIGRHYVLNLPAGKYDLLVLADKDNNKILEQTEVIGWRQVELSKTNSTAKVLTDFDITLSKISGIDWQISIPVPQSPELEQSLVFPKGTIRKLDDPIFGRELSTLGMYEPAAFLERAPTVFYTLEEYLPFKVPVIFVHGMGGTIRDFIPIIEKMDRERYVPWFYYYPTGSDLDQLAENFYRLLLSGKLFPRIGPRMIIVAHSMGGLVVREALNLQQRSKDENTVGLLITIASPFAGHPDSASGVKNAPMVLPAWRDLDPEGKFVRELFRKPLPESIHYELLYAYANPDTLKLGENSDGAVPLSSQLRSAAQKQSNRNIGFNSSHTGILKDEAAIEYINKSFQLVKGIYPDSHVRAMQLGGYDVELGENYNNKEKYVIKVLGKYLAALWNGELVAGTPFQRHFLEVSQGKAKPSHLAEIAWLKFIKEYPDLVEQQ